LVELFQVFPGYAAVMDNQHIFVIGVAGVLGRVEGAGDYYLAVDDKEFMVEIIWIRRQLILTLNPGGEEVDYGKRRDGSINSMKEPSLFSDQIELAYRLKGVSPSLP
jgi:hypothetical protein